MSEKKQGTPIENYFSEDVAEKLNMWFHINSMECLVSRKLCKDDEALKGLARELKINEDEFLAVIQKASKEIDTPGYSGKKYGLGVYIEE